VVGKQQIAPIVASRNNGIVLARRRANLGGQRTRTVIQKALVELADTKAFDRISVGEISHRAVINRATFYRYYKDKYDLVEQIFKSALRRLMLDMGPPVVVLDSRDLDRVLDDDRVTDAWMRLFEHFASHARIYMSMFEGKAGVWFQSRMREDLMGFFKGRIRGRPHHGGDRQVPSQVARCFYASAIVGVVYFWLAGGTKHTAAQMAVWFRQIAYRGFIRTIAGLPV